LVPQLLFVHATAQQTLPLPFPLLMQWPLEQSLSALQLCPFALCLTHEVPTHAKPFATSQSALVAQPEAQAPLAQRYPAAHAIGAGATQLPVPSHVPAAMLERRSAEQVAAPHGSP
jgi:hypothetical protein